MLLKISDGDEGWHYVDDVDRAYYRPLQKPATSVEEARKLWDGINVDFNFVSASCFNGEPVNVSLLEIFKRDKSSRLAIVSSKIYLCTDGGDTIEKIDAGRPK